MVTLTKLRIKVSQSCLLEDYVMKTSVGLLQHLSLDTNYEYNKVVANNVTNVETRIHSIITDYQLKFAPWPVKRDRSKILTTKTQVYLSYI